MSEALADTAADTADATDLDATAADVNDASVDTTDEAVTEPAAPEIDWDSPEIQERLGQMTQEQVYGFLEQLAQQGQQQQFDPSQLDPFEDNFVPGLLQAFSQMLDERLGPVNDIVGEFQGDRINSAVTNLVSETAEQYKDAGLTSEDVQLIGEAFASRVDGQGEQAVRTALKQGADWLSGRDKKIADEAVRKYREGVEGVSGTRAEPGVGGAALSTTSPANTYEEATARVLARHGIPYS